MTRPPRSVPDSHHYDRSIKICSTYCLSKPFIQFILGQSMFWLHLKLSEMPFVLGLFYPPLISLSIFVALHNNLSLSKGVNFFRNNDLVLKTKLS
jgi:hypothetical protein